jgi:hypothetical protein
LIKKEKGREKEKNEREKTVKKKLGIRLWLKSRKGQLR